MKQKLKDLLKKKRARATIDEMMIDPAFTVLTDEQKAGKKAGITADPLNRNSFENSHFGLVNNSGFNPTNNNWGGGSNNSLSSGRFKIVDGIPIAWGGPDVIIRDTRINKPASPQFPNFPNFPTHPNIPYWYTPPTIYIPYTPPTPPTVVTPYKPPQKTPEQIRDQTFVDLMKQAEELRAERFKENDGKPTGWTQKGDQVNPVTNTGRKTGMDSPPPLADGTPYEKNAPIHSSASRVQSCNSNSKHSFCYAS